MKTLEFFIQQPQASLIVAGVEKTMQMNASSEQTTDCILVYAERTTRDLEPDIEDVQRLNNLKLFGIVPDPLPEEAFVGFIKLGHKIENSTDYPSNDGFVYEIVAANVFDCPIKVHRAVTESLNIPFDKIFSSHEVMCDRQLSLLNRRLSVYLNDEEFARVGYHSEIVIEVTQDVANEITEDDGSLKTIEWIQFLHANECKSFKWNDLCGLDFETDMNGELVYYPSRNDPRGISEREMLRLVCLEMC